ncbi:MAG: radical SAM protein [Proteobacteria bacterium]|nr:radical SAM protein [Pseudomonadota bacterium]
MKVLLVQPPRYYWPFISEGDNYLLPQALPYLAGAVREKGYEVKVIDCLPEKIGWESLAKIISEEKPQVVAAGESHALYAHEANRLFRLAKEIDPKIITVAGGVHFTNYADGSLAGNRDLDYIVVGEGEATFPALLEGLAEGDGHHQEIPGIAFREEDKIFHTPPRALIPDLDQLPLPAYDLLPMDLYGKSRLLFSPGGTTIHHSRGCVSQCKFCVWWVQMAERTEQNGQIVLNPKWRTKSVERTISEIEILSRKYRKNCLVFTDDTWNVDPQWNETFAEALIRENLGIKWFAFMRADFILRDEQEGIFEKMVRSGLSHVCIGVERAEDDQLKDFGKNFYSADKTRRCFELLRRKYPSVFRQATFIVGTREETRESMQSQLEFAKELKADYPAFHPLTPVPGTELWEEANHNGWIEVKDFRSYDWMTPVMSSRFLTRPEIERGLLELNWRFVRASWLLKGLFSRGAYKRNLYLWWIWVVLKLSWNSFWQRFNPFSRKEFTGLKKPAWYDD